MDAASLLLVLILWFGVSVVGSGAVAAHKQRSVAGWAVLGFLFGLLAFIIILVLPVRVDRDAERQYMEMTRACPACLARIPRAASACRYCGRDVPRQPTRDPNVIDAGELPAYIYKR